MRRRAEFLAIGKSGRRFRAGGLRASVRKDEGRPSRLGLVTSRKLGPAVVRNRIRRVLREVFRQEEGLEQEGLILVIIPEDAKSASRFESARADFRAILDQARRRLPGAGPARRNGG